MNDGYTLEDYESELFHDMISDIKGGSEPGDSSSNDPQPSIDPETFDESAPVDESAASSQPRRYSSSETSSGDEVPDITSSGDEAPDISDSEEEATEPPPTKPMSKIEVSEGPDFDDDAQLEKERQKESGNVEVEDPDFNDDLVEAVEVDELDEEYILDDEEFVIEEGGAIKILEEEALPEEKVIYTSISRLTGFINVFEAIEDGIFVAGVRNRDESFASIINY